MKQPRKEILPVPRALNIGDFQTQALSYLSIT
jgi:hypothetical protein